jgi:hypothetical protein
MYWKDVIHLKGNLRLEVYDWALFENKEMVERSFSYDLRRKDDRKLIWRICNHKAQQPITASCHVHINPNNEDDRIEFFPDSTRTIFPYVMHCLKNLYENKPQEWEDGPYVENV